MKEHSTAITRTQLTPEIIRKISKLIDTTDWNDTQIAAFVDISQSTVKRVRNGEIYLDSNGEIGRNRKEAAPAEPAKVETVELSVILDKLDRIIEILEKESVWVHNND